MQVMLSDRRKLPDLSELKVTNHMNREAIQQVRKEKNNRKQNKTKQNKTKQNKVKSKQNRIDQGGGGGELRLLASIC